MKLCFKLKKINETNYRAFVNKKNASIMNERQRIEQVMASEKIKST